MSPKENFWTIITNTWVPHVIIFSKVIDGNKDIAKLQNSLKSGCRPITSTGLIISVANELRLDNAFKNTVLHLIK